MYVLISATGNMTLLSVTFEIDIDCVEYIVKSEKRVLDRS